MRSAVDIIHRLARGIGWRMNIALHPYRTAQRIENLRAAFHETSLTAYQLHKRIVSELPPVVPASDPDARYSPVTKHSAVNPQATVFAFGSMGDGLGMPVAEFQKTFRAHPVNVIYFKDFARLWYAKGLLGRTCNRHGTEVFLREHFADLPRPWIFTGASAGGHAAIYFGCKLGADHIVSFSPRTHFAPDFSLAAHHAMHPVLDFDPANPEHDLATLLDRCTDCPPTSLHYSKDCNEDRLWADHLARFDAVTLIPHPFDTHGVAMHLRRAGEDLAFYILDPVYAQVAPHGPTMPRQRQETVADAC